MTQTKAGLLAGTPSLALYILMSLNLEGGKTVAAACTHSHGEAPDIAIESETRSYHSMPTAEIDPDEIEIDDLCSWYGIDFDCGVRVTEMPSPAYTGERTSRDEKVFSPDEQVFRDALIRAGVL